jgi:hypothetical protein
VSLSAWLAGNDEGGSYRQNVKYAVNSGEKYGKLTIIGEVRKVARAPEI